VEPVKLTTWLTRNRESLATDVISATTLRLISEASDRLQVEELVEAREFLSSLYRQNSITSDRRRLRSTLTRLDNEVARSRLELDVHRLSDIEFTVLLSLPQREPFHAIEVLQLGGISSQGISEVDALIALGLVRRWADDRLQLSTRGTVLRKVAAMRVSRKTAEAERTITRSGCSGRYRTTMRHIMNHGIGEPEIIDSIPSVSLPVEQYMSVASIPTIIVSLTEPEGFRWERRTTDSRWSRIRLKNNPDLFRAEVVDFLRSIYLATSPLQTLEVLAITLQDAASETGQELGRIAELVLSEVP
jgi:hypothetical protein